jgi:hypothetical protein
MLKCVEAVIGELGNVLTGNPEPKDAARVLGTALTGEEVM